MISTEIGLEVDAAHLLEVGELGDLQAVEHHLPADAPRAERRRLPVVFLEPDVVLARLDAARLEALQVERLDLVGRGLHDHLELVVLEEAVRVLAEPPVVGPPRRLDVGDVPVARPEHAQRRLRVGGAGADLEIERLLDQAALRGPELREREDEILKRHGSWIALDALRMPAQFPQHAGRLQVLLEVRRDQRPVHRLQFAQRPRRRRPAARAGRGRPAPTPAGTTPPRPTATRPACRRPRARRAAVDAVAGHQHRRVAAPARAPPARRQASSTGRRPAAAAASTRSTGRAARPAPAASASTTRAAEPVEALVGVALERALVDQLREVPGVPQRVGPDRPQRRTERLGVVQRHQLAALLLEVRHRRRA